MSDSGNARSSAEETHAIEIGDMHSGENHETSITKRSAEPWGRGGWGGRGGGWGWGK